MIKLYIQSIISKTYDSNIYIINNEVLIDSGLNEYSTINKISNYTNPYNIKKILLTHAHYDHFGGSQQLINKYNTKIGICFDDKKYINNIEYSAASFFNMKLKKKIIPDFYYKNGDIISVGLDPKTNKEDYLEVIQTPGHTIGSVCFYSKELKVLFSGDTIFKNNIGRTDFKNSCDQ